MKANIPVFVLLLCSCFCSAQTFVIPKSDTAEETIWKLEEAYFSDLYKADYKGILSLVDEQFLAWPGAQLRPIDKNESAVFMKKLVPAPSGCSVKIDRQGIRLLEDVALTQYVIKVECPGEAGGIKKISSRITHTWVKKGSRWKLLGGMSYDILP
ncbi:MAG: nuclear transport factor 2 family protein [Bacteroidetes bacterium]|nr:nuclear transport factor 2 family protein [Bacteroidota bacterium]